MPNRRAIAQRLEVKSLAGPAWGSWGSSGSAPWPALAKFDFSRAAGNLADNSTIAIGLAWIRRNVHKGRIIVGNESNAKFNESKRHPLTELLRRPNPFDSWHATIGGTSDALKVDGNAYWVKARDGYGEVKELHWYPNHCVQVEPENNERIAEEKGPIRGYWIARQDGRGRWYDPADVVHFRDGRDPYCRYMGLSDLKRQIRNVVSIAAAERFTAAVLLNSHAGKVVAPKQGEIEWDDAEALGTVAAIERGLAGENGGRLVKSNWPIDLIDVGRGPEEMVLDRIADRPESYILAGLGLNALVLGLPSSKDVATYANKGEAKREAWDNGVIPTQTLIADEIEYQILPDFPTPKADSVWWDRSDVDEMREDANDRAARSVSLRGSSIITQNEARELVDQPPQEGGDLTPQEEQEAVAEAEAERAAAAEDEALLAEDEDGDGEFGDEEDDEEDDEDDL